MTARKYMSSFGLLEKVTIENIIRNSAKKSIVPTKVRTKTCDGVALICGINKWGIYSPRIISKWSQSIM